MADGGAIPPPSQSTPKIIPRAYRNGVFTSEEPPAPFSITDLRNQILANASVLFPSKNSTTKEPELPALVIGKGSQDAIKKKVQEHRQQPLRTQARSAASSSKNVNSEKTLHDDSEEKSLTPVTDPENKVTRMEDKHYVLLVRYSTSADKLKVLMYGEERDTLMEAMECMLEQTQRMVHTAAVRYAIDDDEYGCIIM